MKKLFSVILLTSFFLSAQGQIAAVEKFVSDHPDLKEYYIYQSTLRMANQEGDEDFNKLIRNIRKINVYVAEGTGEVTLDSYNSMISKLDSDSFETLIRAKYNHTNISLMSKDSGPMSWYVLALHDEDNFALMEMDGKLDLRYLGALAKMDFDKLTDVVMK